MLKSLRLCFFISFLLTNLTALAQEQRVLHNKFQFLDMPPTQQRYLRLVIKFHDDVPVFIRNGQLILDHSTTSKNPPEQLSEEVSLLNHFLQQQRLSLSKLFDEKEAILDQWVKNAESYWGQELANLNTYHQLMLNQHDFSHTELQHLLRTILSHSIVETAYPETIATPALIESDAFGEQIPDSYDCQKASLDTFVGDISDSQGYKGSSPIGINVTNASDWPGGRGEGIRIIDIEGGYWYHNDHKKPIYQTGFPQHQEHGMMVVGVISALGNDIGISGIAPEADVAVRGIFNKNIHDEWPDANTDSANVANNIYWGAKHSLGGVVLIELQRPALKENDHPCSNYSSGALPVEFWPAEFDMIKAAVGNGVVVVEAAGNGSRNLNHEILNVCNGGGCFDREVRDSGAILVAGSHSDGLTPMCGYGAKSNYGKRIDVHAWGDRVATTTVLKHEIYKSDLSCNNYGHFSGSSSASAIIAGAVAVVQGVSKSYTNETKDPLYVRNLLKETGAPQQLLDFDDGVLIGPHPDIEAAIESMLE